MSNREIKFRGQRTIGNEWVYGYLIIEPDSSCWIDHFPDGNRRTSQVKPETIGQFTGLKDKNDNPIFEGDIVNFNYKDSSENLIIKYNPYFGRFVALERGEIDINQGYGFTQKNELTVIGNIHTPQSNK